VVGMEAGLEKPKMCGTCGAVEAPLKCPCKAVFYCNAECQGASWREHRKVCTWDLERKLERERGRLEGEDPAIGSACLELGALYHEQDRFGEAEERYEEALRIFLAVNGEVSEHVAGLCANLGKLYDRQGRLDDGLRMQKRALRVYRRVHGDGHDSVANALCSVGNLLCRKGELERAMGKFGEAHAMYAGLYGEEHERVAAVLGNMAVVLNRQGKGAEALAMQEKALDIRCRTLGSDHDNVALSLLNLGSAYFHQGMLEEGLAGQHAVARLTPPPQVELPSVGIKVWHGKEGHLVVGFGSMTRRMQASWEARRSRFCHSCSLRRARNARGRVHRAATCMPLQVCMTECPSRTCSRLPLLTRAPGQAQGRGHPGTRVRRDFG